MKDFIETYLRAIWVISMTCIVFGLLLWWVDRHAVCQKTEYQTSQKSAILAGLAQAAAMIPGTSRSGTTMTMALYLGYTREAAARFSFLMSIPIIVMAGSYLTYELVKSQAEVQWEPLALGVVVSFISAYLCIHWFLKLVTKVGMLPFVIYRLILGGVIGALVLF